MKVVYVVEDLGLAGGIKVIVEHAEELLTRGHDVSIVSRRPAEGWMEVGVPVVVVPELDAAHLPEADVHVTTWFETVVPTVRAARARRVVHFSQGYEGIYPHIAHRKADIDEAYGQPIPKILISAHLVGLFEGTFPGPFFVLPQAIRGNDYAPPDPEGRLPRRPPTIGIVGPFEGLNKGIRFGLAAVRLLREAGREVRLQRASQLPQSEEERSYGACERYAFRASVGEMVSWYHSADVLIHPSFEAEGFPLPPLEAMAAGVPVVLTKIPSFDPIPDDVVFRVPPGDSAAMAAAAARLLDDPLLWAERRARGLAHANTYTVERAVDVLEEVLQGLLSSSRAG